MALTKVRTEKVPGKITNLQIGKDSSNGVDIQGGIIGFLYARVHDAKPALNASAKTSSTIFQPHSNYTWRLELESDYRIAFKATDVVVGGANEYAMVANGDSNPIGHFKLLTTIVDGNGDQKTRTITVTNGFVLRNGADVRQGETDVVYWYEGIAEYIDEADA